MEAEDEMAVYHLGSMTWEEVRDLDRARTLAILPTGAIEAHGPHLPLDTDVVIALAMASWGAAHLGERGYEVVILPPLTYSTTPTAAGFPGTMTLKAELVTSTVLAIAKSWGRHGFTHLVLANAHLDPGNLNALRAAVTGAPDSCRIVFPDVTAKPWALRLTDEFKSGACHAGRYEGSIVLAMTPERVRAEIMRELPPLPTSIPRAMREGKRTFEEAGGTRAYFGYPADATAEEGRETVQVLGAILAEATLEALEAE